MQGCSDKIHIICLSYILLIINDLYIKTVYDKKCRTERNCYFTHNLFLFLKNYVRDDLFIILNLNFDRILR